MKITAKTFAACSLVLLSFFCQADVPKTVNGLTYHDLAVGQGQVISPGNTVQILIKKFEFSPVSADGRGRIINMYSPTWVVAGQAALGDWNHHSFEIGIIGMRIGGTRLIYSPGLFADTDSQRRRIDRPHVVEVKAVEMNNAFYKQ